MVNIDNIFRMSKYELRYSFNSFIVDFLKMNCNFCSLEALVTLQKLQGDEACLLGRPMEKVSHIRHATREFKLITSLLCFILS